MSLASRGRTRPPLKVPPMAHPSDLPQNQDGEMVTTRSEHDRWVVRKRRRWRCSFRASAVATAGREVEVRGRLVAFVAFAVICTFGCERVEDLRVLWMQGDLGVAYVGEGSVVERASADQETLVIATARRLSGRVTNDPEVTEIEIEETHFVKGTPEVLYRVESRSGARRTSHSASR